MIENNFGLNGYSRDEWEGFLCLSKRCKQNRGIKRKLRNEKKDLKNEERKADIERMRAETGAINNLGNTGPASFSRPTPRPNPYLQTDSIPDPRVIGPQDLPPLNLPPPRNNTLLYVGICGGVLLIGGVVVFFVLKKKRAAA